MQDCHVGVLPRKDGNSEEIATDNLGTNLSSQRQTKNCHCEKLCTRNFVAISAFKNALYEIASEYLAKTKISLAKTSCYFVFLSL